MFCYQCEQTKRDEVEDGCNTDVGMCGKTEQTSDLQDVLIYQIKGIARYAQLARSVGVTDKAVDDFIQHGFFTTLTNVNFTSARFVQLVEEAAKVRDGIKVKYEAAATQQNIAIEIPEGSAQFDPATDMDAILEQQPVAIVNKDHEVIGEDANGLKMLILYGMKGICAYSYHARMLGYFDDEIDAEVERILAYLDSAPSDVGELLGQAMEAGNLSLKVMDILDRANNGVFGNQTPTQVRTTPVAGKCLLVSGHDLHDLEQILKQTEGLGINVYTHGEMLPAHAYPKLKAYPHLVGNYGGAWQDQQQEFANFPGPIILTSNCIIEPAKSYRQRIFTAGPVGWPGVRHISHDNFKPLIQAAKALSGFKATAEKEESVTVGFGHNTVLGIADTVIEAVKSGAIKHFFVIGGCDGAKSGRNYYTELAEQAPDDTIMLTLGCNKFRFNKMEFGDIGGIPRLLDVGQCNDAYSAIKIAGALAEAFECDINELPLSLMVSWFEQKATAVLLALLASNVKGIHLGPSLPPYLTPNLLAVLTEKFDIRTNGTAEGDLARALGTAA